MGRGSGFDDKPMDAGEVLRGIPLFADVLDHAQLAELAAKCRPCSFPRGAVLMTQGDFGATMYAVVDGAVSVTIDDARKDEVDVAMLGPGDIVGEMSLMTGARRTATVTAMTRVAALEIGKVSLEAILARAPELFDSFARVLTERQDALDRIAKDAAARRLVLGMTRDELIGQMRGFFGALLGASEAGRR